MKLAVLGPGGVGGFLAAALDRGGHDVVVVAREPTAEVIAARGIEVQSVRLGNFVARPRATAALVETVEALLVATKATSLGSALDRVQAQPGVVIPLLNGLDHLGVLRSRFRENRVPAGAIRIESTRPEPGVVVQTSGFLRIDLAASEARLREGLGPLVGALSAAGIPTTLGDSEAQVMWTKLVRLNALACTTSAFDLPLGEIRSDPERSRLLERCVGEAAAVARAEGASVVAEDTLAELSDAHAELRSSMQRDIAAGREPELDAIPGAVLRAARRHDLQCPTIAELAAVVAQRAGLDPPNF